MPRFSEVSTRADVMILCPFLNTLRNPAVGGVALGLAILIVLAALPPLLRVVWGWRAPSLHPAQWRARVVARYQKVSTFVWIFAACKIRFDPLFAELREFLQKRSNVRTVLDIGCGYGVPGCALLEWLPEVRVYGLDPLAERVQVASAVFGARGQAVAQGAPDIATPAFPEQFDLVLVLDVIHFLPDEAFKSTLQNIHTALGSLGYLYMRAVIPPTGRGTLSWQIEMLRQRFSGKHLHYRSVEQIRAMIAAAGFAVEQVEISGGNAEMVWYIARALPSAPPV